MEQLSFELFPLSNEAYLNHTIWQPEGAMTPWAVHVEGWASNLDITIYHEAIGRSGRATFANLKKTRTPEKFAKFACKMLKVLQVIYPGEISIRCIDVKALEDGYREGERQAERVYVYSNQS